MKNNKTISKAQKVVRDEQLAYDLIRLLFLAKWNLEIICCLLKEPLYFSQIKKKQKKLLT